MAKQHQSKAKRRTKLTGSHANVRLVERKGDFVAEVTMSDKSVKYFEFDENGQAIGAIEDKSLPRVIRVHELRVLGQKVKRLRLGIERL